MNWKEASYKMLSAYELRYWFSVVCLYMLLILIFPEFTLPFMFASTLTMLVGGWLAGTRLSNEKKVTEAQP